MLASEWCRIAPGGLWGSVDLDKPQVFAAEADCNQLVDGVNGLQVGAELVVGLAAAMAEQAGVVGPFAVVEDLDAEEGPGLGGVG
jgi:hypothetical protein